MIRISAFADEIAKDPIEQIDVLTRNGISHIEFRAIHGTNEMELSQQEHEKFRTLLQERGFGLSAIGSPIGKIQITDPFEPHLEKFRHAMDLAEFYGIQRIRIFSYFLPKGDDPANHRDEVLRRMEAKVKLAEDRGLILVLENEKNIYGDTAARVYDLLTTLDSPALGNAFDSANYLEVGQSIDEAWTMLKDRVNHIHVKDYRLADQTFVPAGQGDGQYPRIIAEAVAAGFAGFVVLEPHLAVAEVMFGFTGPEKFDDAATALKAELTNRQVAFA